MSETAGFGKYGSQNAVAIGNVNADVQATLTLKCPQIVFRKSL